MVLHEERVPSCHALLKFMNNESVNESVNNKV